MVMSARRERPRHMTVSVFVKAVVRRVHAASLIFEGAGGALRVQPDISDWRPIAA